MPMDSERARPALLVQSAYYVATGVLPFISRRAFEAVTGPKREWWLVQTVGALVAVIGAGVGTAAARRQLAPETLGIAAGSAASLAAIDVVHVARGRIAPTYLVDAAIQLALLAALARRLHTPRQTHAAGSARVRAREVKRRCPVARADRTSAHALHGLPTPP